MTVSAEAVQYLKDQLEVERDKVLKERRAHNELYREINQRKDFDNWLRETYPEVIAQYMAAMQLVKFMEEPEKPTPLSRGRLIQAANVQPMNKFFEELEIKQRAAESERMALELRKKLIDWEE